MSSSQKTEYLQLNAWLGTDRPQRIDFVDDNNIIDRAIKEHVNNTTMHCTGEEKTKINNPYIIKTYVGTGSASRNISFDFTPKMVILFKRDDRPMLTESDGTILVNSAIAVNSIGGTGGVSINETIVSITHNTTANNGVKYNFNQYNGQYVVVGFK